MVLFTYCFNRRTKFCKIIHLSGGIELDIFRVSFIGHRVVDEYRQVEEELDEVIELLHRKYGFIDFNVGRNGEFDDLATQAVRRFRREWEEWCELTLVEPYPVANLDIIEKSYDSVIIPTDRKCHYKAAIWERNKWLAENCDMMVVYIKHIDKMEKDGCLYSVVEAFSVLDLSIKTYDSTIGAFPSYKR